MNPEEIEHNDQERDTLHGLYLIFNLRGMDFGLAIESILEIVEFSELTKVNRMNEALLGIVNIRGNVIPVIDLGLRMELGKCEIQKRSSIIIVQSEVDGEELFAGFLVDGVYKFHQIDLNISENAPDFGSRVPSRFIDRMGKVDSQFVALLDLSRIMDAEELSRLEE